MLEIVRCNMCSLVTTDEELEVFEATVEKDTFKGCPICKTDEYLMDLEVDEDALVLTAHNIVSDEVVETQLDLSYDDAIIAIAEHINRVNGHSGYSLVDWRVYEGRGKTLRDKAPANLYIMDELIEYIDKVVSR
jgi:hypothetical protein